MADIHIHSSLVCFTNNQESIQLPISTVGELIPGLCHAFPQLSTKLLDAAGEITPDVNVYIDGMYCNTRDPNVPVAPNAKIELVSGDIR